MIILKVTFAPAKDNTVVQIEKVDEALDEMDEPGTEGLYEEPENPDDAIIHNISPVKCSLCKETENPKLLELYMGFNDAPDWLDDAFIKGTLRFAEC